MDKEDAQCISISEELNTNPCWILLQLQAGADRGLCEGTELRDPLSCMRLISKHLDS